MTFAASSTNLLFLKMGANKLRWNFRSAPLFWVTIHQKAMMSLMLRFQGWILTLTSCHWTHRGQRLGMNLSRCQFLLQYLPLKFRSLQQRQ